MTPRCQLCGEFESENKSIDDSYDCCHACITDLIDNEVERRGEARDAQSLAETGRDYTIGFTERQQLKDAGRGHLTWG